LHAGHGKLQRNLIHPIQRVFNEAELQKKVHVVNELPQTNLVSVININKRKEEQEIEPNIFQ
jgi:hypothetical protein